MSFNSILIKIISNILVLAKISKFYSIIDEFNWIDKKFLT